MSIRKPLPTPDVPLVDPRTGRLTTVWYEYLQSLDRHDLTDHRDVSTTAPANGEVLIFSTVSSKWAPGAN